jgi:hypothetical protein
MLARYLSRSFHSIPQPLISHLVTRSGTSKLVFDVKDNKTLQDIVQAIEHKNYTINTPSGSGSSGSSVPKAPNDIFLL